MTLSTLINFLTEQHFYLGWLIFIMAIFAVTKIFLHVIIKRLRHLTKITKNKFNESIISGLKQIRWPFLLLLPLWLAAGYANLSPWLTKLMDTLFIVMVAHTVIQITTSIIKESLASTDSQITGGESVAHFLSSSIKVVVSLVGAILILSNLGLNLNSLLTGLGISGLIFAFAAQNMLIDSFCAMAILLDKSFQVGDFIKVGPEQGWVKQIGLRTTRLQSIGGQEVIVNNRAFATNSVHNFTRKKNHLVRFIIKLEAQTSATQCRLAIKLIKEAVQSVDYTRFQQANVIAFDNGSIILEAAYYLEGQDYKRYNDALQNINLKIKRGLEQSRIKMIY